MMRAICISGVSLLLSLAAATAGAPAAPIIEQLHIRNLGAGHVDESFVTTHTSVRAGSTLNRVKISKDVKALLATGRFSHVGAEIERVDGALHLVYTLLNKLRLVEPVEIGNSHHFRESKIRKLLGIVVGDLVDEQLLGVRANRLKEEYRKEYYPYIDLKWEINETDHNEGLATVRLLIKEGKRARVRKIRFHGNSEIPAKTLRKAMRQPAWWNPFWWLKKRRYDADELEASRLAIRDIYLDEGYLDIAVDFPQIDKDKDENLIVNVPIREGIRYRIGKVSLEGVSQFPESKLHELLTVEGGDIASARKIRESVHSVSDFYGSLGYLHTVVRPRFDARPTTETVNITFSIKEGRLTKIRNIGISGNTRTRDKVIRRELLVYPGEIFNKAKIRTSERRLANLGYFSDVRSTTVGTREPDEEDLVFEVEEKRTGQFMLGAGFSSIDKMIGFVELSQSNFDINGWPYFTGGGQKLKLRSQFGSRRKSYDISFVEPWFLNKKLSLGFDLYRTEVDYTDYDIERTGGAVSLGKSLPGPNRISFRYKLEKVVLKDIADTNRYVYAESPEEEYFFDREEDTVKSSLRVTVSHDTRNNPFFPSHGDRVSVFGSVSGGILGCDTDIYRLGIRAAHYMPLWFGHVLSVRTRWEVVEEYGDTEEMPIGDRLFIGGGRTLRGFDYRDVGPKVVPADAEEGDRRYRPVGGRSLAMANAEYSIPLVAKLRLAGFYDIGDVWREAYDFPLEHLASSAGAGIRLDIPGFPIRVDRAWVIEPDDELTEEDEWTIWIGYDY